MSQLDGQKMPLFLSEEEVDILSTRQEPLEALGNAMLTRFMGMAEVLTQGRENEGQRILLTHSKDYQLGQLLSQLLKYGVLFASSIVLWGGILYLIRHGSEPSSYHVFRGEPLLLCSPSGVIKAILGGSRRGIIQLGLLFLIATPILRVIVSLVTFLVRRDIPYVVVTMLVLVGLLYGLISAYL